MTNNQLKNFIRITLKGNLNNSFTLPGKSIVKLINGMLKEERLNHHDKIMEVVNDEFNKADYESYMAQWKGTNIEQELFERVKKDIIFQIKEKLKKYEK